MLPGWRGKYTRKSLSTQKYRARNYRNQTDVADSKSTIHNLLFPPIGQLPPLAPILFSSIGFSSYLISSHLSLSPHFSPFLSSLFSTSLLFSSQPSISLLLSSLLSFPLLSLLLSSSPLLCSPLLLSYSLLPLLPYLLYPLLTLLVSPVACSSVPLFQPEAPAHPPVSLITASLSSAPVQSSQLSTPVRENVSI